jgi:hypothetical protein
MPERMKFAANMSRTYLHLSARRRVRERLTVPVLPFSAIAEAGAGMVRGEKGEKQAMAEHPSAQRRGGTDLRAPT